MGKKSEHSEQVALFNWAKWQARTLPELHLLFAIPNGGLRHIRVAKRLKAEGVKSGVPDVFLPVAKNGFHGLWIEMKYGKNKVTDNQDWWLKELKSEGYECAVCYGYEPAKSVILDYLEMKK